MADVLLFHHAHGLTPGVLAFADDLRHEGHRVHTPDLFDGRRFDRLEQGIAYADQVGFTEIIDRGVRAAEPLSPAIVYAGFSMGVMPAQKLAQTRFGARGALLFHSCVPLAYFGPSWPSDVRVQIHAMEFDPIFVGDGDLEAARALAATTPNAELFLYPGDQHLFVDRFLPSYDADAAALLLRRAIAFLEAC